MSQAKQNRYVSGGSRGWFNVGAQLWEQFPNPVLVAKGSPNVAFGSADAAEEFPVQIIEILSLKRMQINVSNRYHGAPSILLLSRKKITWKIRKSLELHKIIQMTVKYKGQSTI